MGITTKNGSRKKGSVELSFNWIFIMVAGGMILLFFVNIATKQGNIFETSFRGNVLNDLDAVFIGAEVSRGTSSLVDIPELDLSFSCDTYSLGAISKRIKNRLIFAPEELSGNQLITWSYDWNVPFRVTNFLYLSNPQVGYVLVSGSQDQILRDLIYEDLPDQLQVLSYDWPLSPEDAQSILSYNFDSIRFVFVNMDADRKSVSEFSKYSDDTVSAIAIHPTDAGLDTRLYHTVPQGAIGFYEKEGNQLSQVDTHEYIGVSSLFGAIFVSNAEDYSCIMKKGMEKLEIVAQIYEGRTEKLENSYGTSFCKSYYGTAKTHFGAIEHDALNNDAEGLADIALLLQIQNRNVELKSCPYIY